MIILLTKGLFTSKIWEKRHLLAGWYLVDLKQMQEAVKYFGQYHPFHRRRCHHYQHHHHYISTIIQNTFLYPRHDDQKISSSYAFMNELFLMSKSFSRNEFRRNNIQHDSTIIDQIVDCNWRQFVEKMKASPPAHRVHIECFHTRWNNVDVFVMLMKILNKYKYKHQVKDCVSLCNSYE